MEILEKEKELIKKIKETYKELKELSEIGDYSLANIDNIKNCFIEINGFLSELKNRNYQAVFSGNWEEIKKETLIKMIIKLRKEVNQRYGVIIIKEIEENNPYHENFYVKKENKKIKKQQNY